MIKAVIFDMDGTLIDSEPVHFNAWKHALKGHGVSLTKSTFMHELAGVGNHASAVACIKKYRMRASADELVIEKRALFDSFMKDIRPVRGAVPLVRRTRKHFKTAVATSARSKEAMFILKNLGMLRLFRTVVTGDRIRLKPFPDIYLKAARRLGVAPHHCLVIEDTSTGMHAAKAAGMHCIVIPNAYTRRQDFTGADLLLKSPSEITLRLIRNMDNVQFR